MKESHAAETSAETDTEIQMFAIAIMRILNMHFIVISETEISTPQDEEESNRPKTRTNSPF